MLSRTSKTNVSDVFGCQTVAVLRDDLAALHWNSYFSTNGRLLLHWRILTFSVCIICMPRCHHLASDTKHHRKSHESYNRSTVLRNTRVSNNCCRWQRSCTQSSLLPPRPQSLLHILHNKLTVPCNHAVHYCTVQRLQNNGNTKLGFLVTPSSRDETRKPFESLPLPGTTTTAAAASATVNLSDMLRASWKPVKLPTFGDCAAPRASNARAPVTGGGLGSGAPSASCCGGGINGRYD